MDGRWPRHGDHGHDDHHQQMGTEREREERVSVTNQINQTNVIGTHGGLCLLFNCIWGVWITTTTLLLDNQIIVSPWCPQRNKERKIVYKLFLVSILPIFPGLLIPFLPGMGWHMHSSNNQQRPLIHSLTHCCWVCNTGREIFATPRRSRCRGWLIN